MHDGLPTDVPGWGTSVDSVDLRSRVDSSRRREARERLELLHELPSILDGSLDADVVAGALARFLVPRIADVSVVDLIEPDGSIAPAGVAHVDPAMVPLGQELRRRYLASAASKSGPKLAIASGEAQLIPEITDDDVLAAAEDEEHLRMLRALGLRSQITTPVRVRGRLLGALTLALTRPGVRYGADDLALAQTIAERAGLAIDNARLYRAEHDARLGAEEVAARLRRLQEVTSALSQATSPEHVASIVLAQVLAAHEGTVVIGGLVAALADDGRALEVLARQGEPMAGARRIPIDASLPISAAFRSGRPEVEAGALGVLTVAVPLAGSGGRSVGAFAITLGASRRFCDEERAFLVNVGRQGGLALERARLFDAERRARVHAEEANRAKDEFLGVVSHELRTPLNAILGWASLLSGKAEPGTALDKGVRVIERNARAQAKIIDDILDVSRIITGKLRLDMRPVDLPGVLRAAVEVAQPSADGKGVTLALVLPDAVPDVAGDPMRLQQVFWNLLSNAVKFTPMGGCVEVVIEIPADSSVRISVVDTGDGIDPRFLPYVFERFRQADASAARRHGGLGLGLAIVRHLVELHGGEVHAESAGVGLGARFTVSLPLLPVSRPAVAPGRGGVLPEQESPRHQDLEAPPLDGLRVLVVDDERDARDVITAVLADRGAVVHAVESAESALAALDDFAPDVLLSDIGMPVEDGYSLLKRLRARPSPFARIPAVALTAFARGADAVRAADAGFAAHLPKPVEPNLLSVVLLSAAGRLCPR